MTYEVKMKSVPKLKVITLRDTIKNYQAEGELWQKLGSYVGMNKVKTTNDRGISIYHDTEYKESNCDVEVCMEVENIGEGNNEIIYRELEAVDEVASTLVTGNYDKIGEAIQYLAKWVEENKYQFNGCFRQITIKHPMNESNPNEYLTELQIPIK